MVRVLSLAMIVATWRGPIPCVHFHGNHVDAAAPSLARHVRGYHDAEPAERTAHWHFHLVLPQDVMHTDDPAERDAPDDPLLSQKTVLQLSDTSAVPYALMGGVSNWTAPVDMKAGMCAVSVLNPGARDAVWRSSAYLSTMLCAAPLCAVTGVALC